MIIRARPKYVRVPLKTETAFSPSKHELFFNTGRAALKFYFASYIQFFKKKPRVVMQSFNCRAVSDPALQLRCPISLLDCSLEDFSTRLSDIQALQPTPDILLLTHYQGLPNRESQEIARFCKRKKIVLIEDCAQTLQSKIKSRTTGGFGDVALHSFAFDKPCTCLFGGSIDIANHLNKKFVRFLKQQYAKLPCESSARSKKHIRILAALFDITSAKNYIPLTSTYNALRRADFFGMLVPYKKIVTAAPFRAMMSWSSRLGISYCMQACMTLLRLALRSFHRNSDQIYIMQLHPDKIRLVLQQRNDFDYGGTEVAALEAFLRKNGFTIQKYPKQIVHWNRYSYFDASGKLIPLLRRLRVEAGPFNWNKPLHAMYKQQDVTTNSPFPNSEAACRHIVNIPVWSSFFRSHLSMKNAVQAHQDGTPPI